MGASVGLFSTQLDFGKKGRGIFEQTYMNLHIEVLDDGGKFFLLYMR